MRPKEEKSNVVGAHELRLRTRKEMARDMKRNAVVGDLAEAGTSPTGLSRAAGKENRAQMSTGRRAAPAPMAAGQKAPVRDLFRIHHSAVIARYRRAAFRRVQQEEDILGAKGKE